MSQTSLDSRKFNIIRKLGRLTWNALDQSCSKFTEVQDNLIIKPIENTIGLNLNNLCFGWLPTEEDKSLFPPKPDRYVPDSEYDPVGIRRKIVDELTVSYTIHGILILGLLLFAPRIWGSSSALVLWFGRATPILNQVSLITRTRKVFERGNEHERQVATLLDDEFATQGGSLNSILRQNRLVSPAHGEIDIVLSFWALRKRFLISVKSLQNVKSVYFSDDKQELLYRTKRKNRVHHWTEDPIKELLVHLAEFQPKNPELREVVPIVVVCSPTPIKLGKHLREQIGEIEVINVKNVYVVKEEHFTKLIRSKLYL